MAGNQDLQAHRATYESVIGLLKWGAVFCLIVAAIVIFIIAR